MDNAGIKNIHYFKRILTMALKQLTPFMIMMTFLFSTYSHSYGELSAVWANTGEDKVTQDDCRASANPDSVKNSVWDGVGVSLFGAKNEVINFCIILEAQSEAADNIEVSFPSLADKSGYTLTNKNVSGDALFDWRGRQIELFYVRYLEIKGLSRMSYETYDERHIPKRFRRPWTGEGIGKGEWTDRPDHNKFYPDIAVPIELESPFTINAGNSQMIWVDVFIPKDASHGTCNGTVTIKENGSAAFEIPVSLYVYNFTLPDIPHSKTMACYSYSNANYRFTGVQYPNANTPEDSIAKIVEKRHFTLLHRHKISMIDGNEGSTAWGKDQPRPYWEAVLDGSLFTAANGYDGPGINTGNNVYSIGTYGGWMWLWDSTQAEMEKHSDGWVTWFDANSPETEYFLYLIDESSDFARTEKWAKWIQDNPGVGSKLPTFATVQLPNSVEHIPSLDITASWITVGITDVWDDALQNLHSVPGKKFYCYNGKRPATGSFSTEDDGIALRQLSWAQYKRGVDRWFYWLINYYNNYQGGTGQTNVFKSAFTFGSISDTTHIGQTGWNYSNGDGLLVYPGTDKHFPDESYELTGPIASLRLKYWRRGVQDVDYLTMAAKLKPARVKEIVDSTIPEVLWEYGVDDINDPTWVRTDISWSVNPDSWEARRRQLADIIAGNTSIHNPHSILKENTESLFTVQLSNSRKITFQICSNVILNEISVMDMKGRTVFRRSLGKKAPFGKSLVLDMRNFSTGMYFVKLKSNKKGVYIKKFLFVKK